MDTPPYADLPVAERMKLLRDAILSRPHDSSAAEPQSQQVLLEQIDRLISDLTNARALAIIREQPFSSHVPVFGKAIVLVRNAWNWMSTKWWVRPIVVQQNNFNLELVNLLHSSLQAMRVSALTINRLSALTTIQQAEILRLQSEIRDLQASIMQGIPSNHLHGPDQQA
jgi:hypothetical protein